MLILVFLRPFSDTPNGGFHTWRCPNSWMVYNGKSHLRNSKNGWFGSTSILGNLHMKAPPPEWWTNPPHASKAWPTIFRCKRTNLGNFFTLRWGGPSGLQQRETVIMNFVNILQTGLSSPTRNGEKNPWNVKFPCLFASCSELEDKKQIQKQWWDDEMAGCHTKQVTRPEQFLNDKVGYHDHLNHQSFFYKETC